jgi:hypothetical protein
MLARMERAPDISSVVEPKAEPEKQNIQTVQESSVTPEPLSQRGLTGGQVQSELPRKRTQSSLIGYLLLVIGLLALTASVLLTSTILVFVGLGVTLWGALVFFVQPQKYVKSDLMNATAASSLKTIDKMMLGLGYREKGVYVPSEQDKAVVFVPSEPFSNIPKSSAINDVTFLEDPRGLLVVPPGLALASLIEKKIGFNLKNCGVERLVRALPKVLVEDLEIVRDVEVEVKGNKIDFKLVDSIYADFCREVRDTSRRCGLGCPMCSALACILAVASGKPVVFEEDMLAADKRTTISSYELIDRTRL